MNHFFFLPGDRVVVPKSWLGIVQHHAIYDGNGHFYENKMGFGVVRTPSQDFLKDVEAITEIQRFQGTNAQLHAALARAKSLLGKRYHLTNFNCEHFADFVQFGRQRSQQVEIAAGIGAIVLLVFAVDQFARS